MSVVDYDAQSGFPDFDIVIYLAVGQPYCRASLVQRDIYLVIDYDFLCVLHLILSLEWNFVLWAGLRQCFLRLAFIEPCYVVVQDVRWGFNQECVSV